MQVFRRWMGLSNPKTFLSGCFWLLDNRVSENLWIWVENFSPVQRKVQGFPNPTCKTANLCFLKIIDWEANGFVESVITLYCRFISSQVSQSRRPSRSFLSLSWVWRQQWDREAFRASLQCLWTLNPQSKCLSKVFTVLHANQRLTPSLTICNAAVLSRSSCNSARSIPWQSPWTPYRFVIQHNFTSTTHLSSTKTISILD